MIVIKKIKSYKNYNIMNLTELKPYSYEATLVLGKSYEEDEFFI
jgi:hypothetical protein